MRVYMLVMIPSDSYLLLDVNRRSRADSDWGDIEKGQINLKSLEADIQNLGFRLSLTSALGRSLPHELADIAINEE